jgi:hypothetical protein
VGLNEQLAQLYETGQDRRHLIAQQHADATRGGGHLRRGSNLRQGRATAINIVGSQIRGVAGRAVGRQAVIDGEAHHDVSNSSVGAIVALKLTHHFPRAPQARGVRGGLKTAALRQDHAERVQSADHRQQRHRRDCKHHQDLAALSMARYT